MCPRGVPSLPGTPASRGCPSCAGCLWTRSAHSLLTLDGVPAFCSLLRRSVQAPSGGQGLTVDVITVTVFYCRMWCFGNVLSPPLSQAAKPSYAFFINFVPLPFHTQLVDAPHWPASVLLWWRGHPAAGASDAAQHSPPVLGRPAAPDPTCPGTPPRAGTALLSSKALLSHFPPAPRGPCAA